MRVKRTAATDEALRDGRGAAWEKIEAREVVLVPTPLVLVAPVSPYLALSQTHGAVKALSARAAHNGETLSIRLAWEDSNRDDRIADLDRFSDAAAVVFPLLDDANPITMGDEEKPVNAWLWRADLGEPFDVIARGYSTSERRPAGASGLAARGQHADGQWVVVFQRPLHPASGEFARFDPGAPAKAAFAVWEGSNAERAGQKAISGAFIELELDR
jgi:DMSO reductase family type II enzyme heme b subunit